MPKKWILITAQNRDKQMGSIGYFVIRTILTRVTFRLEFSLLPAGCRCRNRSREVQLGRYASKTNIFAIQIIPRWADRTIRKSRAIKTNKTPLVSSIWTAPRFWFVHWATVALKFWKQTQRETTRDGVMACPRASKLALLDRPWVLRDRPYVPWFPGGSCTLSWMSTTIAMHCG